MWRQRAPCVSVGLPRSAEQKPKRLIEWSRGAKGPRPSHEDGLCLWGRQFWRQPPFRGGSTWVDAEPMHRIFRRSGQRRSFHPYSSAWGHCGSPFSVVALDIAAGKTISYLHEDRRILQGPDRSAGRVTAGGPYRARPGVRRRASPLSALGRGHRPEMSGAAGPSSHRRSKMA